MIPHLVKGTGVSGAVRYVMGEGNDKETGRRKGLAAEADSRVAWVEGQGFGFPIDSEARIDLARRVMEWAALPANQASKTRKCENDCLHLSLSWEPSERPDAKEMLDAARGALKALGMENARALFVCHEDTAHPHLHIVASRIDPDTGKAYRDKLDVNRVQEWAAGWERDHGQVFCTKRAQTVEAIKGIAEREPAAVLDHLTRQTSTFTRGDLDRLLKRGGLTDDERQDFGLKVLAEREVIGLRETADSDVTRYTTRTVLAAERAAMRDAGRLDGANGFDLAPAVRKLQPEPLDAEQAAAFRHATAGNGLALIAGEAGTGKSRTLAAVRDAYEGGGFRVVGLAWTNSVVQDMRGDGFRNTSTIAAALKRIEAGQAWDGKTVLVVDEAAMLATKPLAALLEAARLSGTKVILAGDDRQLGSIERGGLFTALQQQHGAAELHTVRRVDDAAQRQAFNAMHKGDFGAALAIFDERGGIHWTDNQAAAQAALVTAYAAAAKADPSKSRFIFAYTNIEVAALNAEVRGVMKAAGHLGDDRQLATADGCAAFAEGDRIQFTANARNRSQKEAGLVNGAVGVIRAIEGEGGGERVTVELDGKKGAAPRVVSFTVGADTKAGQFNGFRHGYAGTIYRGQGRTLDETFVYHSQYWRSASSYVALSRHRDNVALFVAKDTAKDVRQLARQMARVDDRRAASAFVADKDGLVRSGLQTEAQPAPVAAPKAAAKAPEKPAEKAQERAAPPTAPKVPANAPTAAPAPAKAATPAPVAKAAEIVAQPVAAVLSGAVKALEGIADFLVGAVPKAPPTQAEIEQAERAAAAHALLQQQQAALAAKRAEYLAAAKTIYPTNEAEAARLAQEMESSASSGRSRRDRERDDERRGRGGGRSR